MEDNVRRRLVTIFAADVVGYSRLMEGNEEGTLEALKRHRREFFDPTISKYEGRIFKVMGDGFLVEFGSVLNAARCAVEIQRGMLGRNASVPEDRHIKFRIGINLGDMIIDGDDVYGEGVNIAARLEALAGPGGIACSAIVRDQVGTKLELEFVDHGEQAVKNITRPVRVYLVSWGQEPPTFLAAASAGSARVASAKPSVAVLPFTNMSNDPEQEFFSDGMTEDIITDLAKVSGLFVLGRNTVFTYKGRALHLERVAKELGVAYLVEGSVRKAGRKVRINAQLIDGATGGHLWAERYDGDLSDVFALQDEITFKIVKSLKVKLLPAESTAIQDVPTENMEAYAYCLRGRELLNKHNKPYYKIARGMFLKAAELDPAFAGAYAGIADCDSYSFLIKQDPGVVEGMLANTAKAIALEPNLAAAYASRGLACWAAGEAGEAEACYRKALQLDPDLYEANYFYGRFCRASGDHERAVELFERAAEVRPADYKALGLLQGVNELLQRPAAATSTGWRVAERVERELRSQPDNAVAAMHGAMALAAIGETTRSRQLLALALSTEPDDPATLFNAACAYSRLGEIELALDLLERVNPLIQPADRAWTRIDPDLRPLHGSPRFQNLIG